jgi:hypothetical protein
MQTENTLADIQELRWLTFVLSKVSIRSGAEDEVRHRVACLRGERARPWTWAVFCVSSLVARS